MSGVHVPVLLNECIEGLNIDPNGIYVDGTLGRGGHSEKIAERLDTGRLICIDRDQTAIDEAGERLKPFGDKITFVKANFRDIGKILDGLNIQSVNGMLFDLGVSSPQLDDASRGFSYMADAPLDMRMDTSSGITAFDVVNFWQEDELRRILFEYGEERYSYKIASAIVKSRAEKPISTTFELVDVIRSAMPAAALREKQHPAKRTFQAIRIAVNDELGSLSDMLGEAMDRLSGGGRLCVISFHSLEDRIVKNAIKAKENGCTCPPEFPVCVCGFKKTIKTISRKPIVPTKEELEINPRSRSAKLRIAEKL
jgi:16S rRNA (cytosine1402-N4)-methyltransferase